MSINKLLQSSSIQTLKSQFLQVKEILAGLIVTTIFFVFIMCLEEISGRNMVNISLVIEYFQFNLLFIITFISVFLKENKRKVDGKITWVGWSIIAIVYATIISLIQPIIQYIS
ncbi:MAG: hypothetical protein LBT10_05225 [Methanobrevibacter sp.]|jgi:hypothetical protein|nr:hypothetical protein [Methanobrevibacter sp.]